MAVDLHNRDSLLLSSRPQQYFTDQNTNIFSQNSHNCNKPINPTCFSFSSSSCFSSSDFGSALNSPVESELCSTESESDKDDDYIAELSRQMAHYMLQDDENIHENEGWSLAYPQQLKPEVPIRGKFENLKINEEKLLYNNDERFLGTFLEPNSIPLTMRKPESSNLDFQSKQALIDYQIRAIQFYKLEQEQIMKQILDSLYWRKQANRYNNNHMELNKRKLEQIHQSKGRACGGYSNLQQKQRTCSDMTAVFLGDKSGLRTGSCGTGVFLPRKIGKTCEPRKKHGCSTVLMPARVVQALKLQFEKMGIESRSNFVTFPVREDGLMGDLKYGLQDQKKSQSPAVPAMNHQEMGLPQEWTY